MSIDKSIRIEALGLTKATTKRVYSDTSSSETPDWDMTTSKYFGYVSDNHSDLMMNKTERELYINTIRCVSGQVDFELHSNAVGGYYHYVPCPEQALKYLNAYILQYRATFDRTWGLILKIRDLCEIHNTGFILYDRNVLLSKG